MHADGAEATGFKSMVVAQFTGISLQKDDRAFVLYNQSTGAYEAQAAGSGAHINGLCKYRKGWRHCHIKASNDAFIQVVSVFAVGFGDHFFSNSLVVTSLLLTLTQTSEIRRCEAKDSNQHHSRKIKLGKSLTLSHPSRCQMLKKFQSTGLLLTLPRREVLQTQPNYFYMDIQ